MAILFVTFLIKSRRNIDFSVLIADLNTLLSLTCLFYESRCLLIVLGGELNSDSLPNQQEKDYVACGMLCNMMI